MTEPHWRHLPAGAALRRIVAERLGWHLRKVWVGSAGIEYDFLIYDNDDRLVYQREIRAADLEDEGAAVDQTWLYAMEDEACPRWDQDLDEARDLAFGMDQRIWQAGSTMYAWVKSSQYAGEADTQPLAVVRAWLAATQDDPTYFH